MKYQNKEGISLNFSGNCSTSVLVREVVSKAITILQENMPYDYDGDPICDTNDTIGFLKENFDIEDKDE
jgi:hypothetical protein